MFNLLVSGTKNSWETDQLMSMELARFKEYSGTESQSISHKPEESLKLLEQVPSMLMYESCIDAPNAQIVRFGYLSDIRLVGSALVFRFIDQGYFDRTVVEEFSDRLGMSRLEHNRTHWAIKDGDLPSNLLDKITPVPYGQQITEITRRRIIDSLILRAKSFCGDLDQMDFLKRIWNLASMPSTDLRFDNAEGDIWQHTISNEDWDVNYLLYDYLELRSCSDKVFLKFTETAAHPLIGDETEVRERLSEINQFLRIDGYELMQTHTISSRPIYSARKLNTEDDVAVCTYEVVLSFAGEDRDYVEQVARYLKDKGVNVFYDLYEEATLWGKDLAEHLDQVYRKDARYCLMFISKHYAKKIWANHERRSALARALEERQEYILPARFDETEVPGIRPSLGYVDLSQKTPEELGRLVLSKLGRHI